MKPIASLSSVLPNYDALLLDLWGVVHDGSHLYPGVHEVLVKLKAADKKVIFISNAPRRSHKVIKVLQELGIERDLYIDAVSSGEVGHHWLSTHNDLGKRYHYIGPAKDADVLDGLDYTRVDDIKSADFLLNVGYGSEESTDQDLTPLLRAAKALALPMVCLNPDLEVVKITGQRFACAGLLAEAYARLDGKVIWFGKPYEAVYERCMALLADVAKPRILAIGDSLHTDIAGAKRFGIDSVLVTGGILKKHTATEIEAMCQSAQLSPNYITPHLAW